MVPQRGVELHAGVQKRLIGHREVLLEIGRLAARVEVVTQCDDELERKDRARLHHLPRDVDLGLLARAHVADRGQTDRIRLEREREVSRAAGRQDQRDKRPTEPVRERREVAYVSPVLHAGGRMRRATSTTRRDSTSIKISVRPTTRYATSAGSGGNAANSAGERAVIGSVSG